MSETIGVAGVAMQGINMVHNRTLDLLLLGATAGIIWLWWTAHTADTPTALVPNQNVSDIKSTIPEGVYTYNMPFYGAQRRKINSPNMPSPNRVPYNPSSQPTFAAGDTSAESPGPVQFVAEY